MKDAIGQMPMSRSDRDREVVQRTAELLTSSLSLEELFQAVCLLLARFIDASTLFIALKDQQSARIAYVLDNGVVGTLEQRVRPGSSAAAVLQSGRPMLKRRLEDWTEARQALNLPGQPQIDDRVSAMFVPLKFGSKTIGVLSVQSTQPDAYDEADLELLQTCALYLSVRIHQAQLETQSARLENIASTDSLTGVSNRRSFNERFSAEWRRAIRRGAGLSLLIIDIDFFKPFNDTYGHVAGDAALHLVANTLSSCLSRSEDFLARYGGEEFIAILPDTNLNGALAIAERMRSAVFDLGIAHSGSLLQRMTLSAGVAWKIPVRGSSPESLLEAADTALYQAKRGGRNRVAAENYRSDAPAAYPSKAYRHNLPQVRGRTFGGAEHSHQIRKLLRGFRLLSIVGPAGIGKSRQAIEAARREIARFPDGVFYVDCSVVTDQRYLANKVGSVLGVPDTPLVLPGLAVSDYLKSKKALLILDNCDGVEAGCKEYVRALLAQAPDVRVLTTSRAPALTPSEVAFVLPPLCGQDAKAFFLDRTKAIANLVPAAAEQGIVETICRRLDGSPRALQLAAAKLQTLTLAELEQRLPEQTSLNAGSAQDFEEWSYEMLAPQEQALLRALSIFAGGAVEEALDAVCGSIDGLNSLVEKALVRMESDGGEKRYVIAGSLRMSAGQRARDLGEWHDMSHRHAHYYCRRARQLDATHSTGEWQRNLARMVAELDNLRAALLFTVLQEHDLHLGAELTCYLVHYWQQMGRAAAGREWIENLLARRDVEFTKAVRAKLLYGLARLDSARSRAALDAALPAVDAYRELHDERGLAAALFEVAAAHSGLGDIDAADAYLREALEIATRIEDMRCMADVLNGMAVAEQWRGHAGRARELLERSLELFRALEDDRGVASMLGNLGDLAATVGEYDRAVHLSRQSLAIFERLHDPQATAWQLMNIGAFELKRRNADAARPAIRRALELVREYRDEWLSANCVDCLARLALAENDCRRALRLSAFADTIFEAIGVPRQPPDQLDYEYVRREAKSAVGLDAAEEAIEAGRAMSWAQALAEAMQT